MAKKPTSDTIRDLYELRDLSRENVDVSVFLSAVINRLYQEAQFDDAFKEQPVEIGSSIFELDFDDPFFRPFFFGYRHEQFYLDFCIAACPPGGVVWDVGASAGLYAVQMAKATPPPSLVLAFEPGAKAFRLLRRNVERNGVEKIVKAFDCALGAADGKAEFHEARNSAMSGLSDTRRSPIERVRPVAVRTADAVWAETGKRPVDIMKIDVEGHEYEVLGGAAGLLAGSPNITVLFEISHKNLSPEQAERLSGRLANLAGKGWSFHLSLDRIPIRPFDIAQGAEDLTKINGLAFMTRVGSAAERSLPETLATLETRLGADTEIEPSILAALEGIKNYTEFLLAERDDRFTNLSAQADKLRRQIAEMGNRIQTLSDSLEATKAHAKQEFSEKQGIQQLLTRRSDELAKALQACASLEEELKKARR